MGQNNNKGVQPAETRLPSKQMPKFKCSLCIPSTIIDDSNARNLEQVTSIAYQVSKVATLFNVQEVIVLRIPTPCERESIAENKKERKAITAKNNKKIFSFTDNLCHVEDNIRSPNFGVDDDRTMLFATLLEYFVTPPYLVKSVFATSKFNKKFYYASKLPKLTSLPFMSNNKVYKDFREGLTIPKHTPKIKKNSKKVRPLKNLAVTKYVNIGTESPVELVDQQVPVNVRATVDLVNKRIVSPVRAYGVVGAKSSFGYFVRPCDTFSGIFKGSPFPEGYTSSIYVDCAEYCNNSDSLSGDSIKDINGNDDRSSNVLIMLGSSKHFAYSFEQDKSNLGEAKNFKEMVDFQLKVPDSAKVEDATSIALTKIYDRMT